MTITTAAHTTASTQPAAFDFGFDVDTVASLALALSDVDRKTLHSRLGVREASVSRSTGAAFEPNIGDPRLDKFMREHHNPKWKAPKVPTASKAVRRNFGSTADEFERAVARMWKDRGYGSGTVDGQIVITGEGDGSPQCQETTADLAPRHQWPADAAAAYIATAKAR